MTIIYLLLAVVIVIMSIVLIKTFRPKKRIQEQACKPITEIKASTTLPVPNDFGKIKLDTPNENAPLAINASQIEDEVIINKDTQVFQKQEPLLSDDEKEFINQYNNEMNKNNY